MFEYVIHRKRTNKMNVCAGNKRNVNKMQIKEKLNVILYIKLVIIIKILFNSYSLGIRNIN